MEALTEVKLLRSSSGEPVTGYDIDNIFAKIIAGQIPSYKVMETDHAVAILDAFPMAEGHVLLLPKKVNPDTRRERTHTQMRGELHCELCFFFQTKKNPQFSPIP